MVTGRRSEASLYDFELATYDTGDTFDQTLAKGFVELWGLPSKMAARRDQRVAGTGTATAPPPSRPPPDRRRPRMAGVWDLARSVRLAKYRPTCHTWSTEQRMIEA